MFFIFRIVANTVMLVIQVYLPALVGLVPDDMIRTISTFMECCYIIRRSVLSEESLSHLETSLSQFHQLRKVFEHTGVRPDGMSLPRQHSLDHYPRHIREFGAPNGLCSSITESKHIKAVKEPWCRSNRFKALGQMLVTNQRLDKIHAARSDFEERDMLKGSLLSSIIALLAQGPLDDTPAQPAAPATPEGLSETLTLPEEDDAVGVNDEDDADAVEGPRVLADVRLAQRAGM